MLAVVDLMHKSGEYERSSSNPFIVWRIKLEVDGFLFVKAARFVVQERVHLVSFLMCP